VKAPGPISSERWPHLAAWLNQLREFCLQNELKPGVNYRTNRNSKGTVIDIRFPPSARGSLAQTEARPFTIYKSDDLQISIRRGTVTWHDKTITFSPDADYSVTVPGTVGDYYVWLQLNDEFAPTAITVPTPATGAWSGYPVQPTPPARKYFMLGTVSVETVEGDNVVTDIEAAWFGGDIIWPSILSMYS
jgi:hypothetical protein